MRNHGWDVADHAFDLATHDIRETRRQSFIGDVLDIYACVNFEEFDGQMPYTASAG